MREIKFRVFDNDLKSMHVCGENEHDSMVFFDNIATYYNLQNGCGSLKDDDGNSTYVLMQYTGLKDKNGVGIYEGDIGRTFNGNLAIVKFGEYQDESILDTDENFYKESIGDPDNERCSVGFFIESKCGTSGIDNRMDLWFEIIGSIHQNPELLKTEEY